MAHIDSLLKFITQKEAQTGWLISDAPSQFATSTGTQAGPTLTGSQIEAMVKEIAPEDARAALQNAGAAQFNHTSSLGTFAVQAQHTGGQWQVAVTPLQVSPTPANLQEVSPPGAYGSAASYGATLHHQGHYPPQGGYQPQGAYSPQGTYPPQGAYGGQGAYPYGVAHHQPSRSGGMTVAAICLVVFGGLFVVVTILAAILFPVFARARENALRISCQSNLKQIGLATMLFAQAHQERFPTGTTTSEWQSQLFPYARTNAIFQCPAEPGAEGYEINPKLSGVSLYQLSSPAQTPLCFEHRDRHLRGCNILFADGHVRWYSYTNADAILNAPAP